MPLQLKYYFSILSLSLVVLSCTTPSPSPSPSKTTPTPASTQAASKPLSKTPRALLKIELGGTASTLDRLYEKLPGLINSQQLRYNLQRELNVAFGEIDLSQGSEAVLGFSEDISAFVAFSFALRKDHKFSEKIKSTPGLDLKGHQFAVRPLPGSLLSPFNRVLYLDVKEDRLLLTDQPEGLQRLPLQKGLSTPTLRVTADFASLWHVFGMPYQEAYISEKDQRQFESQKNEAPEVKQSDIFWESLFILAGSIHTIEVQADTADGALVSVVISTKRELSAKADPLAGAIYEILPGSQFGFRAELPTSVLRLIAESRKRLAPPAFDSLSMYYPLAQAMGGKLFFGGGIEQEGGFWAVGQYSLDDFAMARVSLQRHFSETPKPDAMVIEQGRTFTFKEGTKKDGVVVDVISSILKDPTPLDRVLQIESIETHYEMTPNQAITSTGKSSQKYAELLRQKKAPQIIPEALITLLEKPLLGTSQPTSQTSVPAPFAFFGSLKQVSPLQAPLR